MYAIRSYYDVGKKAATVVRGQGLIPCVVYGGEDVVHFSVTEESVRGLIYTPNVYVVELVIDGKKITSIMKDIQFHPVSDKVLHIDFIRVSADKPRITSYNVCYTKLLRIFAVFQLSVYSLPFNVTVLLFLYILKYRTKETFV